MIKLFGESNGVTFQNPDFIQLAASFGIKGMQARNKVEFETIITDAQKTSNEIVLIEAILET